MLFNYVLPTNEREHVPTNTVGLYIRSLLDITLGITDQVTLNGVPIDALKTESRAGGYSQSKVAKWLPSLLTNFLKDAKLFSKVNIPLSYFVDGGTNIVFVGHNIQLPPFSFRDDATRIVGLLDEPPSLGDNFKTKFYFQIAAKRFRQQLLRFDSIWVYHEPASEYLKRNGIQGRVSIFPCVLDYSPPETREKIKLHSPVRIAMASSFLPWHGTVDMVRSLRPHLEQNKIELTLIGDGPMKSLTIAESKGIQGVRFIEGLSFKDYQKELANHDFGILWSIPWFNSPLKLMDYARAGLAIITHESLAVESIWSRDSYFSLSEFLMLLDDDQDLLEAARKKSSEATKLMTENWGVDNLMNHLIQFTA